MGEKGKKRGEMGKYRQAKQNQRWPGDGERAAEPGDMPLTPFPLPRLHLLARFARHFFPCFYGEPDPRLL